MHFESEVFLGHTTWAAYNSYFPRIEKTMMLHLRLNRTRRQILIFPSLPGMPFSPDSYYFTHFQNHEAALSQYVLMGVGVNRT